MLACRASVRRRVPTALQFQQQQQRLAATAAAPARRTWTAYKKAAPASSNAASSATATTAPTAAELQAAVGEQDDMQVPPELEHPPSSSQPLPAIRSSLSAPAALSHAALESAALPSITNQLAPSYPTPAPQQQPQQEIDWSTSFHGISSQPFSAHQAAVLMRPLVPAEIEIKPGQYSHSSSLLLAAPLPLR